MTSKPKTIAFLGTSRERGVMQTIVAMFLNDNEKLNGDVHFTQSDLIGCRGYMTVRINGIQMLYRDVRTDSAILDEEEGTLTCHG
jgi:hypothetical protein